MRHIRHLQCVRLYNLHALGPASHRGAVLHHLVQARSSFVITTMTSPEYFQFTNEPHADTSTC